MKIINNMKATAISAAIALSMGAGAQNVLTPRQQCLTAISSQVARGDIKNLETSYNKAFEVGFTQNELKEISCHLYAYMGFPKALNGLSALQRVIADRQAKGLACEEGRLPSALPEGYDALREGTEVQSSLFGPYTNTFSPTIDYYLKAHLFGDISANDLLTHKERELVTISALASIEGLEAQLNAHLAGAQKKGMSKDEMQGYVMTLSELGDEGTANRALKAVAQLYGETTQTVQTVDFSVWPKGDPNPYGQYFKGQSYLTMLGESGAYNVTFEPGCRNNWHIHHGASQVLICVAGHGWYQEWGKEAVPMTPGTIIAIPEGVKHWHGAAKDSWFQHIGYEKDVQPGASNEWLEPVADDEYNKL
jgi:alkylhydroperoxidase/carboxymuconolactone decarboxylase family protein YurZ/quercetin dioxygenase-like cupin family protein